MNYTSVEQSKRLLELGLKPETADMYWMHQGFSEGKDYYGIDAYGWDCDVTDEDIPCWSAGKLIDFLPGDVEKDGFHYYLTLEKDSTMGYVLSYGILWKFTCEDLVKSLIYTLEWLIKDGYIKESKTIKEE